MDLPLCSLIKGRVNATGSVAMLISLTNLLFVKMFPQTLCSFFFLCSPDVTWRYRFHRFVGCALVFLHSFFLKILLGESLSGMFRKGVELARLLGNGAGVMFKWAFLKNVLTWSSLAGFISILKGKITYGDFWVKKIQMVIFFGFFSSDMFSVSAARWRSG